MTALNSEGLEKARCATAGCGRPATQRFEAGGVGSDHCDDCAEKIRVAQPALPPVDGLEVVAWDVAPKGLPAEPTKSHSFVAEIERQGGSITPLVALSQASSVIAGLRSERITAERDALEAYRKLQAAEARIAELEAAIDSAEIAGGLTENGNLWRFWSQRAQETAGKAQARISSLEEKNKRLREALNQSRLAFSGYVSPRSAIDMIDAIGDHNG